MRNAKKTGEHTIILQSGRKGFSNKKPEGIRMTHERFKGRIASGSSKSTKTLGRNMLDMSEEVLGNESVEASKQGQNW